MTLSMESNDMRSARRSLKPIYEERTEKTEIPKRYR
jgi:hypothetical protein